MAIELTKAVFNGSQDYVDVTWDATPFGNFVVFAGEPVTTGPIPGIALQNVTSTGARVVTTARFTGSVAVSFINVVAQPVILSISPTSGPVATVITISGYFLGDATSVRIGPEEMGFGIVDSETIEAIVPSDASTGPISVIGPGGTTVGPVFTLMDVGSQDIFGFRRTIAQPADGSDFFASFPTVQPDATYAAHAEVVAGGTLVSFCLPTGGSNRTTTHLRVQTSAPLPDGAVIEIIATRSV